MTKRSREIKDDQAADEENEPKCRPDSWWSWLVCTASTLSVLIVAGIVYSFGLLLPPLMKHFNETRQATAWIGSLYLGSGYIFSPIAAYINERFSYRFTAILGSILGIIGFFLATLSSELWMMYLTYGVVSGVGHLLIYMSSSLIVLQYFVKWRSVAVGIVASAPAIGMFVMTQFTQSLLTTFKWPGALRGFALLHFVCGLCASVFVPLDNLKEESSNVGTVGKIKQKETASKSPSLCRNYAFLIMLTSFFVVTFAFFIPIVHIVKHCRQELHIPEKKVSMLFTYMAIASFISRNLFCKLGDFRCFNRFHLYQGGMTISGLCVLCLPSARSFSSVVAIFMVFGLMEGAFNGQYSLLILECSGKQNVNQAYGYTNLLIGVSTSLGSPMAGFMADKLGSYTVTFYTAGTLLIAGASITSLMALVKQHPEEAGETESYEEELLVTEKLTVL
ncbi:hypothetical protein ACROYT_G018460 [Oculina patagonica]